MVPKRRFKEFLNAGDWEQRKLEDVCSYQSSSVTINDIDENGRYDLYDANSLIGKTNKEFMEKEYITIIKDGAGVGRTRILPKNSMFLGTMGAIKPKNSCLEFLYQLVTSANLEKMCTGSTIPHIYFKDYGKLKFYIPSIIEQEVIGKFFNNLDYVITLHQRKLDKLQATKKALLQEMFPEEGQDKPKRRFKGFTDAWEQRKLGDIAAITGGGTPSTNISEYWNGDIDWYSPVEIGENRYVSGSTRKITKLGLEKSSAKILPVGTVLFTSRAGIGNTAILQVEGCTNQGFQSITPNSKELDTYFLYTMTPKLKRYGEVTGAGSTFVEVSGKQMELMNLMIPSLEEQKCVSQLFKVMDDTITLHQRKLDKLKNLKQAYLNEMFV